MDANFAFSPTIHSPVSTLLISKQLIHLMNLKIIKNKGLHLYFHKLMSDPFLKQKLRLLHSQKWRKSYQQNGLDLHRFNFRPACDDWATLSILSYGSGFSRCFIFVFLMLIESGLIPFNEQSTVGTPYLIKQTDSLFNHKWVSSSVFLDRKRKKLKRRLQQR